MKMVPGSTRIYIGRKAMMEMLRTGIHGQNVKCHRTTYNKNGRRSPHFFLKELNSYHSFYLDRSSLDRKIIVDIETSKNTLPCRDAETRRAAEDLSAFKNSAVLRVFVPLQ